MISQTWVDQQIAGRPERILPLSLGNSRIWVKRPAAPRPVGLYRALRLFAWLHGLSVLTPAPRPGGAAGLRLEAQRLKTLAQYGVQVPDVLLLNDRYLCISELPGQNLAHHLENATSAAQTRQVWLAGIHAIGQVHCAGSYISQCFSRNMIVAPDLRSVGFIDFEDDPGLVLQTPHAQARDWLLFFLSSAVWIQGVDDRHDLILKNLGQEPVKVQALTWGAMRRLAWLRHLPQSRKLGKDAWWLQAAAQLGHECLLRL